MLRAAAIAALTVAITVAMASVAGGIGGAAELKPEKQPQVMYVVAPMDGIFWRGEYPGALPYVEVGQAVEVNSIVGQIEHMRNSPLYAGYDGTITAVLISDGQWVKAFQPLLAILPKPVKKETK